MYEVVVSKQVRKFLLMQDVAIRRRLSSALVTLAENPFLGDVKRLRGQDGLYRKRVGSHRILYEVKETRSMVLVIKIASRNDVYKRL